ncbi:UvrD-helicase domain-containing protein, partial [Candidatus Woesearchaeota archaeon]|nr:UvrD-helicase domain-containing protein [Candidatus Woesearchaeota archaeon]
LETVERMPFGMGKNLLLDVLTGSKDNETVMRHRLDREQLFGCLSGFSKDEVSQMLSRMRVNGLVEQRAVPGKSYYKVFRLTQKGKEELRNPKLDKKRLEATFEATPLTEEDKLIFSAFDFFLKDYSEEQNQAIVSRSQRVLCVAGAGSGKTTVLTKRIEFLVSFCDVDRNEVLAITFTRKAREEMQRRLGGGIQVETFNSFCERTLSKQGYKLYGKPVRMLHYRDRIRLLHHALKKLGIPIENIISRYFTTRQKKDMQRDELTRILMHDIFSILDYYANNNERLRDFSNGDPNAKMIHTICRSIRDEMREAGLRDYSDQLTDALRLFAKHPELIPQYDHILVDEYQDVNKVQKELLDILAPKNLFVVGDPRQSIFGWRGSRVRFIIDFPDKDCQTVILSDNYRSKEEIVSLANNCIKPLNLPDMESKAGSEGKGFLRSFKSESDEAQFIAEKINSLGVPKEEIFILTRTNRQLDVIAQVLKAKNIPHIVRQDESYRLTEAREGEVTLSTVHAIKGLEADVVFVAGVNSQSFPCVASDHAILELVKREEHDREQEELRLLYVAITRAKKEVHLSYVGTVSRFVTNTMKKQLGVSYDESLSKAWKSQGESGDLFQKLRQWRSEKSRAAGIPPYMIFPDKTLLALAREKPGSIAELHSIDGIGPVKARKYGEELLEQVRNA